MTRVNITGPTGTDEYGQPGHGLIGWFDLDKATACDEDTYWDGNNRVSVNPVGPYGHQILYRTAGGRWVLHTWSQRQGVQPTYEYIDDQHAREWLLINNEDGAVEEHFGYVEEERGPGRPEVGARVDVRLGELLPAVDTYAAGRGLSRATAIRELVAAGLGAGNPAASLRGAKLG